MDDEQVLKDIDNIKIPYPSEGIIRTAQLDDTIAPPNSVQLATNMNFDRVGAVRTRPGVTQYADDLVAAINNYGTLHNEIVPAGYKNLTQLGGIKDFQTSFKYPSAVKVSDTKVAIFWSDTSTPFSFGWCQNFSIDEITGAIIPLGVPLKFETTVDAAQNKAILVSPTLVMSIWSGSTNDGLARTFDVSLDQIAFKGAGYTFDSTLASYFSLAQVDSTHFILFWSSNTGGLGKATIFAVDLSAGTITEPGSQLTFDSNVTTDHSTVATGDGIHFLDLWFSSSGAGHAQTFLVNTGTWGITAVGSALANTQVGNDNNAMTTGDGQHFVNVFKNASTAHAWAQAFNVNPSTFAVTLVGTPVDIDTSVTSTINASAFGDGQHFISFYSKFGSVGFVQMLAMDPVTFNMSLVGELLTGYDFGANSGYISSVDLTATKVMVTWGNAGAIDGQAVMFEAYGTIIEGRWLYAGYSTKIANVPAGSTTWTDRRTGLATVSKPRFTQFLNYIWMVNGNDQIGGDPVATSNGGAFGTDLVPTNFPKGDYIHGGFEGRVWIADKTLGIIYYTDIVQFSPPNVYTLTYNEQVNIITTIAPQTGETFTGFCEVPRALLVFTQNTITRIYGAASIDAYAAYNVGTFSQESIITVKNGIYFHHSSGFYQFTPNVYAAQPTEISRRIIDFIQAIPRAYYENITAVYDGFDNIEWSVGPVTVEGVTFANCVCRFTISTQIWTIYDYVGNTIKAMIFYDDGTNLNHLMGTAAGKTGAMDTGTTDFGQPFYFEFIDRWRSFTEMYYQTQRIDAVSLYHQNAAGANISYQGDNALPNQWKPLGAVNADIQSLVPNGNSEDFTVTRLRIAGTTKGAVIYIHGIEIPQITQKGQGHN